MPYLGAPYACPILVSHMMPYLGAPCACLCLRSGDAQMPTIILLAVACKDHNMSLLRCKPSQD